MVLFLALAASVLSGTAADPPTVVLQRLHGDELRGELQSIADGVVTLLVDGSEQTAALDDVLELQLPDVASVPARSEVVRLVDGTTVSCSQIRRTAREVTGDSELLGGLTIPAAAVASVQLQPTDAGTADQWAAFLDRDAEKDLLVVPKRDGAGLDFLSGIVNSISGSEVSFLLDGDTIPVPRTRVFGVVFASAGQPSERGLATVSTAAGDLIVVRELSVPGEQMRATASWNQGLSLPLSAVRRIDFSRGRIRYLSDLKPVAENFYGIDPEGDLFAGLIDDETARRLYGPARDGTLENGAPLRLRGKTWTRGLCLHSRTELVYALDGQYRSFETIAGVDDQVAFNLDREVLLVVTADGEEVLRHTFQTRDDPLPISIPVDGVRTLSILVDYADNNSQCDWLDLADAKLILNTDAP